jgi:hypothetical protein
VVLEICQDGSEGSDSDATTDDYAVGVIVETLGWSAERAVDSNADISVFGQVFEGGRPVAFEFDVDVQGISFAVRDGEWMPLEEGNVRDLQ